MNLLKTIVPNNKMSEFNFDRSSDWDLQAIVKGRSFTTYSNNNNNNNCNNNINTMNNIQYSSYNSWFESLGIEDYQGYENTTFLLNNNEPQNHGSSSTISGSPQEIVESSTMNFDLCTKSPRSEQKKEVANASFSVNNRAATISKRRKNKHKIIKMVQQAGSDRVLSDNWNWRKYGEKVIKGSPYPRSYYRCSYPGGCSARKQVEQSSNDPGLFLITYMEEHAHPYPTRRHSQAGRSAKRFNHPSSTKVVITNNEPITTLVSTMTSESSTEKYDNNRCLALQGDEDDVDVRSADNYVGENQGVCFGNRVFEDDFFAGLDYLEGLCMNLCN